MNRWLVALLVMVVALIQAYFLSAMTASAMVPNILLAVLLAIVLTRSLSFSLVMGLWAGWWLDVASSTHFATRLLWFGLFVLAIVLLRRWGLDLNRPLSVALVVGGGVLLYNSWLLALNWLDGGWGWPAGLWLVWLAEVAISIIIGWVLVPRLRTTMRVS